MPRWLGPNERAALPLALDQARAEAAPAPAADLVRQLMATLVLVAPASWSGDQSEAWQAAAASDLHGIPADLLAVGCAAARRTVDHPSGVVAAIHAAVDGAWSSRKGRLAKVQQLADIAAGRREQKPWEPPAPFDPADACPPEAAAAIVAEFGLACGDAPARRPTGPLCHPTDADYREMMGDAAFEAWKASESAQRSAETAPAATTVRPCDPNDPDAWRATIDAEAAA